MADQEIKFCEDCRFCRVGENGMAYARCGAPRAQPPNTGERYVARELSKPGFCATQRMDLNGCGPDARWFEPKPSAVAA